ncbi:MAG: efflux transporter outer membrane subunit [Proteobacteria bacterium]|uniref:efflux transporter outer membrane subunit n=1 Tax=Diaphorobacter sp. LR2014-1 TaxID=1933219 RepID=UPI000CDB2FD8|nr:efflux transporter outer membrane subunit [Diaphorobacter sp. LR2014-1]MBS0466714.1 efflux transporter outer membrane subunit [Pseudomonadota bacterium]MBS0493685.1 efflux transporter outer membrane subunit [Pseudomonadota bacterium]POR12663.1 RND transporter [Diaphorobacter sp. LR2014-1]
MTQAPPHRRTGPLCAVLLTLAALAGCADMSGIAPQAQLREPGTLGLPAGAHFEAPDDWWRGFGDPQLDALIAQALADNPGLKQAQARLARAQAFADTARSAQGPRLDASLDASRQRYSSNGLYPPGVAGATIGSETARLTGNWELDFFGKNQAALQASLGQAEAAQADAQAARLLLASRVAQTYLQLARLQAQLAVAERQLAQRSELLRLVQGRVHAGLDTRLELRQSEGALPETRQQIEALREQQALTRNALGALIAEPNVALTLDTQALEAINNIVIPTALPADLLGRRPDVAAARWRVAAATQDMAVARAQFYPNVSLTAFVGLSSIQLDRFMEGSSREWGVGPALRLPIFDSGRLRANLRGRAADLDAAVESYNTALLDAVHDAADQLASSGAIARQIAEQRQAGAAAEDAYSIAQRRYEAGLGNYLQVLSAETQVLAQRRQAVDLAARRLDNQVALMRALGGGYAPARPVASAPNPTNHKNTP